MKHFYPGDRVRIDTWETSSFHGMRGLVVGVPLEDRVKVHLDGDVAATLFFPSEIVPLEDE